ncbi:SEL1-like repeat protein [Microbulbifer sp. THAF38]|uniref:SEL1-like repeat protein n=1 Tax=Microbulbifer sp. THAF38 TaxID=2587856 RepID=UPI0012687768|nr:SEL1-like repeat protein [Microbulbifer sp. THAF38]QFT56562.1 Putative beta-lactamase HcpC precursor [Microbulbifer sp. THAF38]
MKKLLILPTLFLLASCASQTAVQTPADPLQALTEQVAQAPDSVRYATYWSEYLKSPQPLRTLEAQDRYQSEMIELESGRKTCTEINWEEITLLNSISLLPHLSAAECYESAGNSDQANYHQNIFNFIATGILSSRRGDTFYSAYEIASWADAEDLLSMSGYEILDNYFEFAASRSGLYRVYNVRDPDSGKVRKIYFDNSRFLHRLLEIQYPFAGLSDSLYKSIIQPLAESDYAARHAVGQVQEAEGEFQQAEQTYLEAIGMGSLTANISLGNLCLEGNSTMFAVDECAQLFVAAADLGLQEGKILLAYITTIGLGIEVDTELARQLLASAAVTMLKGEAEYAMALLLASNQYNMPRTELAEHYLQLSAQQGYAPALLDLAGSHMIGKPGQEEIFADLISQAAEKNYPPAQFYYGKYLLEVAGNDQIQEGIHFLQQSAGAGFPAALYLRGRIAENGLYQQKEDEQSALRDFEKAALSWHHPAQFRMGVLNSTGKLVPTNHELAYGWYALCAKINNLECVTNLGYASAMGAGVEQDYHRAIKIYQYAAQQGSARASYNLGLLYQNGQGVEKDLHQARQYLTQAAEAGSTEAMNALGILYLNQSEGTQDYAEALAWFERASKHHSMYGLYNQGRMYEQGLGVNKDQEQALELYKIASELGHTGASLKLARAYSSDELKEYDLQKALHFLTLASEQSGNNIVRETLLNCQKAQYCSELDIGKLVSLLSKAE